MSNVSDSLIAACNSFQIVGAEKLKERLPKLVVQKGIDRRIQQMCAEPASWHGDSDPITIELTVRHHF